MGDQPRKLDTKVRVGDILFLSNLTLDNKQEVYQLNGLVSHFGQINSGHYTATCDKNGTWVGFSDQRAAQESIGQIKTEGSEHVFLCVYTKTTDSQQ